MSEMIERVARAIALSHEGRNWEAMMEHGREWHRRSARAAVKAMREPTRQMETAVECTDSTTAYTAWQAMIDEALKDQ